MKKILQKTKKTPVSINNHSRYIRKVTWIGLLVNLLLSCLKFCAGYWGASQALMADATHSLSDSITDIAVIFGSYFWANPPDEAHPHGHQRIETFITIFIGCILFLAGIGIGWHAIITLPEKHAVHPGWLALSAAVISIIVKEVLFRYTDAAGKKVRSSALNANAWHHRLDALSSIPAFLAIGGFMLFPNLTFLDHVGAIIISIFIMHASLKIVWPNLHELLEKGAPETTLTEIRNIIHRYPKVIEVHRMRTRYLGASLRLDFQLMVDGNITVKKGHDIAEHIKDCLLSEIQGLTDVVIHIEPCDAF